ncbi:MAG TPA: ribosome maturation factor RimM [Flavobacteriales bacterium]|mgnify:CR=1 FL=1|nr:ribosome maturation factor RimM [Flavobacteriales bacterium]HRJ38760.1 ribosome maturation factor RimM [Flavobacteriales bacterium]
MKGTFSKDDCFNLGYITRLHGYKGEFNIFLDVDSPSFYDDLDEVLVEMPQGLVTFTFTRYSPGNKGTVLCAFEGVDSEQEAKKLIGKNLWLPLAELPPLDGNKFYYHEVIGFVVVDAVKGNIGTIKDVYEGAAQTLLCIINSGKEILLPVLDATIVSVDRTAKQLHVSAPEGLIEMYLDPNINKGEKDI